MGENKQGFSLPVVNTHNGERVRLLSGGAILTVTGLHTILELRADSTVFLW